MTTAPRLPYAGWMAGTDFVMPGRFLQAEPLARMISELRPTMAGAVPTIWNDILTYADSHEADLSSIRLVPCGGSAVPLGLQRALLERHGVKELQAWGMTETSPVSTIALPPVGVDPDSDGDGDKRHPADDAQRPRLLRGDREQRYRLHGCTADQRRALGRWLSRGTAHDDHGIRRSVAVRGVGVVLP